ncbi:AAA family ATPase [Candidatus Finniella inopinata]|uniref:AAA family ATPase n=1 Tax=Candidatus Finniella inopinata TaxID=1696036 RepID=A0A4Q7DF95_9PROT|nr:ATP-binding protein [Candidatus Finniella inopinata]RZI45312.1 AAA family ATPase [Candidatus Finniella inopinata]
MKIIGRDAELKILKQILTSNIPEFLAIYGRRRVGKTFLIRSFFEVEKAIFFNATGSKDGTLSEQIRHFTQEIGRVFYHNVELKEEKNWDLTFEKLTAAFNTVPKNKKIVLFLDEFPWMATQNSRLLQTLEYYWNQHWSRDKRIKLIICGSSASWIIEKIVNNKGGLHNRLTRSIYLEPFNLRDSKRFLNFIGVKFNNDQILQIYMVTGGIPYYLSKIEKGLSATQNIENLAFQPKSFLAQEFDNLFSSLYEDYESYVDIIRLIATRRYGIGQEEILQKLGKNMQGKLGLKRLKDLQDSNFIISFMPQFHKRRGIYYKLIDEYTLFYLDWIEPINTTLLTKGHMKGYWEKQYNSAAWNSWSGYAFESVCYKHLPQISQALNMSPTSVPNTWRYTPKKGSAEQGAQIDLLFDRDDDCITMCEIKYTEKPYAIDKHEAASLNQKIAIFKEKTRTKKQIFLAIISANGIKKSIYSEEMIDGVAVLDDLFK